jgi:hypothetical protein
MGGKDSKSRDFDHLIEQNSTELSFLSAYGGLASDTADSTGIFSAIKRFMAAGGVEFSESKEKLEFEFGYVKIVDNGVKVHVKGKSLPLVASDLTQAGFVDGKLPARRGSCTVTLQDWDIEQRRFVERLVEHLCR